MEEIKVMGEIKDGGFWPKNPELYMEKIRKAGTVNECVLTITGTNVRSPKQHRYAFAVCNVIAEVEKDQGWPNTTPYKVYKRIEQLYCKEIEVNEETGKERETITPLKEQPPERFWEIIEEVRQVAMETYDIVINTPAQHYGLSEKAYDLWKLQKINFAEARKMTEKETPKNTAANP